MPLRTTPKPSAPLNRPQSAAPGFGSLLSSLLGGVGRPVPASHRPTLNNPVTTTPSPQDIEKNKREEFTDTVLGFIRPVFISIIGKVINYK